MVKPTQIRRISGDTFRRHFLNEWLEERSMSPMDLLNALNEAASMDTPVIDKSQVYRWLRGQLPHRTTQIRIADALGLVDQDTGHPDPELLTVQPAQAWIARKVSKLDKDELDRLKDLVELAFPEKKKAAGKR